MRPRFVSLPIKAHNLGKHLRLEFQNLSWLTFGAIQDLIIKIPLDNFVHQNILMILMVLDEGAR